MIPGMEAVIQPDMTPAERVLAIRENNYENQICALVGRQIEKHYPGWRWYVECRLPTGVVTVRNLDLDGEYGFIIPIVKIVNETDPGRIVMRAAGEVLERYRQQRGGRPSSYDIERNFKGQAIGDTDGAS